MTVSSNVVESRPGLTSEAHKPKYLSGADLGRNLRDIEDIHHPVHPWKCFVVLRGRSRFHPRETFTESCTIKKQTGGGSVRSHPRFNVPPIPEIRSSWRCSSSDTRRGRGRDCWRSNGLNSPLCR